MSRYQHTAGPLRAEEGTPDIIKDWNGRRIVVATVRAPEWHEDKNCGGREAFGNALLFAAASDLLEALEEIINTPWIGGKGGLVKARMAIAKAKGE